MKTIEQLRVKIIIALILVSMLASSLSVKSLEQANSSNQTKLELDKISYMVSDPIKVGILPSSLEGINLNDRYDFFLYTPSSRSKYVGPLVFPLALNIGREGSFSIYLYETRTGMLVDNKSFTIGAQHSNSSQANPNGNTPANEITPLQKTSGKCGLILTVPKSDYAVGERIDIGVQGTAAKNNPSLTINGNGTSYRFVGELKDTFFVPEYIGTYWIIIDCLPNITETITIHVDQNITVNQSSGGLGNPNTLGNATENVNGSICIPGTNITLNQTMNFTSNISNNNSNIAQNFTEQINRTVTQIVRRINLRDSKGNLLQHTMSLQNAFSLSSKKQSNDLLSNLTRNITQNSLKNSSVNQTDNASIITSSDAEIDLSGIDGLDTKVMTLNNVVISDADTPNIGFERIEGQVEGLDQTRQVESFAIDLSNVNFTNGTLTKTAKGRELWKCASWNFSTQTCLGTWQKVSDLVPGQDYAIQLSPTDPGFSETGVASINTERSIYHLNEDASILIVVLDTEGYLVSDANIELEITDPNNLTTTLSTDDNQIEEQQRGIYRATYANNYAEGNYTMRVHAYTDNVDYVMSSHYIVKQNYEFDIIRNIPVTIDPNQGDTESRIRIIANNVTQNFELIETLPLSFAITDLGGGTEQVIDGHRLIKWSNLSNDTEVSYRFQAPLASPELYLIGPSTISYGESSFVEARPWYLAIDPLFQGTFFMFWDGPTSAPYGWTCVSCNPGDPFYNRFIMGDSTYGSTGGNASHNHTVNYVSMTGGSASVTFGSNNVANMARSTHTHAGIVATTTSSASNYPMFRQLKVIAYSGRVPMFIPKGAIGIFNSSSMPANWTQYSPENGYFILANATANTTGGSNNHTHLVNITTAASALVWQSRSSGNQTAVASDLHTHNGSNYTSLDNNTPPYIDIVLGQASSNTSVPYGQNFIGMFNESVGNGWINMSQAGEPFFQKILRAAATYNATGGGSNVSSHGTLNITTGGPNSTGLTRDSQTTQVFATTTHTHDVNVSFTNTSIMPPYIGVVFAYANTSIMYPPIINRTGCYKLGSGWVNCSTLVFNTTLSAVRTSCYSDNFGGNISNVTFVLTNIENNITFFNVTITNSSGGYYTHNLSSTANITILNSGTFNLDIVCRENPETNFDFNWTVPWGNLVVNLTGPTLNTNVTQYRFFNFSVNVSCIGGQCGNTSVTLDPQAPWWNIYWRYRRQINITNSLASVIRFNYSIKLVLNTLGNDFMDNGSDVRIVLYNGTDWTELDRINETSFNSSTTEIWFRLQSNISASGFNDSYYVYYGNPIAGSPPTNKSNVYLWYDNFDRPNVANISTEAAYDNFGSARWNITNNQLIVNGSAATDPNKLVVTALGTAVPDVEMEVLFNITRFSTGDTSRFGLSQDMDIANGRGYNAMIHTSLTTNNIRFRNDLINWGTTASTTIAVNQSYYMRYRSVNPAAPTANARVWLANNTEPSGWMITGNYGAGAARAAGYVGITGPNGNNNIAIFDDLTVRYVVSTEPNATALAQETGGKGDIPMFSGTPFYTINNNPVYPENDSCLFNMTVGNVCTMFWLVNATGQANSTWSFYATANPINYASYVNQSFSRQVNITIIGNVAPVVQFSVITPLEPIFSNNLTCTFNITDENIEDTLTAIVNWYKNGESFDTSYVGVTNGLSATSILDSSYLTVGDIWSCGITPYDAAAYGTELMSQNVTILETIPPKVGNMQCLRNGAVWVSCPSITYNQTIGKVRASCTATDSYPVNVTFTLRNNDDSKTFFSGTTTDNSSGYWEFDNVDLLVMDSGTFNLSVNCTDANETIGSNASSWLIPWGNLTATLVSPNYSMNVTTKQFFNFTSVVTCSGGECGHVNMTLDPYREYFHSFEGTTEGWTHYAANGTATGVPAVGFDQWHVDSNGSKYGNYSWKQGQYYLGDYLTPPGGILVTPTYAIRTSIMNASVVSFYHYLNAEDTWDGGKMEYRLDEGAWTKVANTSFITGWYNRYYDDNPAFLPAGWVNTEAIWTNTVGALSNFTLVRVNISTFVAENITFRFYFSGDDNTAGQGWFIDGFNITAWDYDPNKGIIPMTTGALPFYTTTQNPATYANFSCPANMQSGDSCTSTWQVNATDFRGTYEFFVIYNSINYSGRVLDKNTSKVNITIVGNTPPNVTYISLDPLFAVVGQNLYCSFTISDASPLDRLGATVVWYRNNSLNLSFNVSVQHNTLMNVTLGSGNLTPGDTWHCGVRPFDQQSYGNQVNSSNKTVLIGIPPRLNSIQCQRNGTTWINCSSLVFGDNITGIRVNCTNVNGTIRNVTMNFSNTPDNKTFFNIVTAANTSDLWNYSYNMTIADSGEFILRAACTNNYSVSDSGNVTWSLPWGIIRGLLVDPNANKIVEYNKFFTFTANVSCTGGECGNISAWLDPGFPLGSPSNGTADIGLLDNPSGGDQIVGSYTFTWTNNSQYYIVGKPGWGDANSRMELVFNLSTLNIDANKNVTTINLTTSYCHSGNTSAQFAATGCDGDNVSGKQFTEPQDFLLYNTNTSTWDSIGTLNVTNNERLVYSNYSISGSLSKYVNSSGFMRVRFEMITGGTVNSNPAWLGMNYVLLTVTYDYIKGGVPVPVTIGALPFYTNNSNPYTYTNYSCLANMSAINPACQVMWYVNATGRPNTTHEFWVIYNTTSYISYVNLNYTKHIFITIENSTGVPPTVTLNSPGNNNATSNTNVIFNCSATDNSGLSSMALYGNFDGFYVQNETASISGLSNTTTFNLTLPEGVYTWNCLASDIDSNTRFAATNRTLTIDYTPPYINLTGPPNGSNISAQPIAFNFTVLDITDTQMTCNITVDSAVVDPSFSATNGSNISRNVAGFTQGSHSWNVTCKDRAGNVNTSDTWTFTIMNTAPTVVLQTTDNYMTNSPNVDLFYFPDDNRNVTQADLYINGIFNDTDPGVLTGVTNGFTLLGLTEGRYNWTVNVTDDGGLTAQATYRNFIVDLTKPTLILSEPLNGSAYNSSTVFFNFTSTDNYDQIMSCKITINGIDMSTGINAYNNSVTNKSVSNIPDGVNYWNITCVDDAGNFNVSQTRTLNVTAPPTVTLNNPADNASQRSPNITLYYTPADNNNNITNCTLYLNGTRNETDTTITSGAQNNFNLYGLPSALYNWSIICVDNYNTSGTSLLRRFSIDNTAPNITLNRPNPFETVYGAVTIFNYTAYDNIDPILSCNLTIDGAINRTNIPSPNGQPVNVSVPIAVEGNHTWSVSCRDDAVNTNVSETRNFTVVGVPTVALVAPAAYAFLNYTNNVNFTFIPSSGNNLVNATLYISGVANKTISTPGSGVESSFLVNITINGAYNWSVMVVDDIGLVGVSSNRTVIIDTIAPNYTIVTPTEGQVSSSNNVTFRFSVRDNLNFAFICNVSVSDIVEWQNITVTNGTFVTRYKVLPDGNYNWSITCMDNASNINPIELINFSVSGPPNITLYAPIPNYRTRNTTVIFNYSATDPIGIENCSLYINGLFNQSTSTVNLTSPNYFNITEVPEGDYNWSILCIDLAPDLNVNYSETRNFTIDLTGPAITLNYPGEGDFMSASVQFNWTAVDYAGTNLNCTIYLDDIVNRTLVQQSGSYFTPTINGIVSGNHNWTINCSDDLNNTRRSETRNFTVNKPDLYINHSQISFNSTNPDENNTINITVNVSNIGGVPSAGAVIAFWDGYPDLGGLYIGNVTANITFNSSRIFTILWNITQGYHVIYVTADPLNNISELIETNNNATRNISILKAIINLPLNGTLSNESNNSINFTLQEFTGATINYSIFVDNVRIPVNGTATDNISSVAWANLSQGIHSIKVEALDLLGRRKNSSSIMLIIDLVPPVPTINTPNLTWFNTTNISINITATDAIDTLLNYTLFVNDARNQTGSIANGTHLILNLTGLPEGIYNISLEAKDDVNLSANSTIKTFYVDITKPTILLTYPEAGSNFTSTTVLLNFTVTDNLANSTMCTILLDGTQRGPYNITNTILGGQGNYTANGLAEGTHTWNVTCTDLATNQNTSQTRTFNVFIVPNITLISPTNATWTNNGNQTFIYNVTDNTGIQNCSLLLNGGINQTKYTENITNNGTNNFTVNMMNGTYMWAIECYDNTTLYAYSISQTRWLYVDVDKPNSSILTTNGTWFRTGAPNISFILSDNMDPVLNYTFYVNGTANISGTSGNQTNNSRLVIGLLNGTYLVLIEGRDEAGNIQNSSEITIYIDTVRPYINLTSPQNNTNLTSNTVDLNFTAYDNLAGYLICNMTLDSSLIMQNFNASNGVEYNVTRTGITSGYHLWNVTCVDFAGNFNSSQTYRFYISKPDIVVNESEMYFSNGAPIENETINITATIRNLGNRDAGDFNVSFYNGDPQAGGRQLNGNITINLSAGEARNVTINFSSLIGTTRIFIAADIPLQTNGTIDEENESNNKAYRNLTVGLWQYTVGLTGDRLVMNDNATSLLFDWDVENSTGSNLFVVDSDSRINWLQLQALGRNMSNLSSFNDFAVLDQRLNSTNMTDNVNFTYTMNSVPREIAVYNVYNRQINNVPATNSTNNENFKTGILWDYGDGGQTFNGTQDVIFITMINQSQAGFNSTVDYEIRIPATLRQYKGPNRYNVDFYFELR